jgi:hypothetical protein
MWNFMTQSGMATTVVDFTREFSPLLVSLVGLVWLSAGMIAYWALQDYLARKARPEAGASSVSPDHREAA